VHSQHERSVETGLIQHLFLQFYLVNPLTM
jgi:hypothetical protein